MEAVKHCRPAYAAISTLTKATPNKNPRCFIYDTASPSNELKLSGA